MKRMLHRVYQLSIISTNDQKPDIIYVHVSMSSLFLITKSCNYYIHLTAFFPGDDGGWQWHQVDHMQIICTSLQTDNHPSTSLLSFYRPDALPATQPTASKHWRLRQKAVNVSKNSIKINIHSDILLNDKLQESEQKNKKPIVFYITVFIILRIVKQMLHLHRGP